MGSASLGKLFFDISGDSSRLNASLKQAMDAAEAANVKITRAGQGIIASFDAALNPTKRLAEEIRLLELAGRSSGDILAVLGKRIESATSAANAHAQPVDSVVKKYAELADQGKTTHLSVESLGKAIGDFARNPVQAAQAGLTSLIGTLGPTAIGIGAIATAAVAAGAAIFKMGTQAADTLEHLENMAASTGLSTQQLQALQQIGKEAGLENLDLARSIGVLNRQLANSEASEFVKVLNALRKASGETAFDIRQGALAALDDFGAHLRAITDPEIVAKLGNLALGKGLRELIPLLVTGNRSLKDLIAEQVRAGTTFDEPSKGPLKELDHNLDLIGRRWKALGVYIGEATGALVNWFVKVGAGKGFDGGGAEALPPLIPLASHGPGAPKDVGAKALGILADEPRQKEILAAWKKFTGDVAELAVQADKKRNEEIDKAFEKLRADIKKNQEQLAQDSINEVLSGVQALQDVLKNIPKDLFDFNIENDPILKGLFPSKGEQLLQRDVLRIAEETAKEHKRMYESIIANVRDGAGQVFDAMLTKGQNVFTSLAHFVSGLFNSLARSIFQDLASGLARILTGSLRGGGAAGASQAGIGGLLGGVGGFGGAAIGGLALPVLGASIGASAGGLFGGGIGGQISGATAGAAASVLGFAALGGSFTPLLFALLTNPATWAVAAGLIAVGPLIAAFKGKNSFTAGAPEIKRDLGIDVGSSTVQQIFGGLGVSESQAYPIRKDLLSSPVVLRQLGDIAKQQGQYGDFLKKLESIQTSWGTFNFRQAFELGTASGDWTKLDEAFTAAFTSSKALQDNMPDWTQKLLIAGHAIEAVASATDLLIKGFTDLKTSIEQSITTAKGMYQAFLDTGEITDAFAAKITELGGDLEVFKRLANLSKISTEFAGLADHLRQTGEVLPRLRELFTQFGGDLASLDNLGALPGLQTGLANINDFIGGLQQLLNQLSPVQQVLSGQWGAETWGGLAALGLDPSKLTKISDLIRSEKGWDQAVTDFQKTGRLQRGGILEQNIWQYGGAEGATAIERNRQGFNTITPELLAKVRAAMDAAYQAELKTALTYLGTVAKTTSDQIATLTTAVETQFTIVSGNITIALDAAKQAVVDQLGLMLDKLNEIATNTAPATTQTADTGGGSTTAGTDDGNTKDDTGGYTGEGGGGGPMIELHVHGNVYGLADVERVVTDSVDNAMRRGWNPAMARR